MRKPLLNKLILIFLKVALIGGMAHQAPTAASAQPADGANLAVVATPSASFVSGDTSVAALNDGFNPRNSRDTRHGSYGNWNRTGTQWVQYEWSQPISTAGMDVYWWADGGGIHLPAACRLSYWNGESFIAVSNVSGLGVEPNKYNRTTFDEVQTTKLRLEIDAQGSDSTGILEWKAYDSGKSPKFPPVVSAGVDRSVVTGGKTYLTGTLKSVQAVDDAASQTAVMWSKASGPGDVVFADAKSAVTSASFAMAGDYVLKLTATQGDSKSESTLAVRAEDPPPPDRLDVVYTKNFKVNNPLWNSRVKALIVNWIPHCVDEINRTNIPRGQGDGGIDNFVEAAKALAGQPHKPHKGYVFANAWVHQTVEAMSIALQVDPQGDPEIIEAQKKMKATLDDWIPKILAAQEPDGYLQTAWTLRNTNRWQERWSEASRGNHEGYTAGYFIESAINHYTMTGGKDKRLYDAAKRLADCWYNNLGPAPKKPWYDGHEEMEQALVRFGRFVNDMEGHGHGDHYIQLAKFLLDCRSTTSAPGERSEYDQSHLPVTEQYEAVGHAVRAVYLYSGMADVAAETHDTDYQSAVLSLWNSMVNTKYYATGGVGSVGGWEGFGPAYALPNAGAYCEACASCGEVFFDYKMNLAYHDAKYADAYEEVIYNALLGATDLDGKNFFYQNHLEDSRARRPWDACPCCVGNIPRTLLMLPTWMYVKGTNGIYVNLFIGSTARVEKVAGTDVQMEQVTDYPWSGKVSITVNPKSSRKFSIYVRVPSRGVSELYTTTPAVSGLTSLAVNGKALEPVMDKGYAVITRKWRAGDKIDVEFPLAVQKIKANDRVGADRGRVALRYGPLIYNVESVDQTDNNLNRALAPDAPLATEWDGNLLDGVEVIKGTFADGTAMKAIPNYARLNRGGRSTVWMKDGAAPPE
jgi:DUF1680 family protein